VKAIGTIQEKNTLCDSIAVNNIFMWVSNTIWFL